MASDLYDGLSQVASALANPTRLRALNLLFQGPKPIDALAELLGESHANTAAHLKVLRAAGLVGARRQGKHVIQEVVDPDALRVFMALREAAERHHPATQLQAASASGAASAIEPRELQGLLLERKALVYDLRPAAEFAAGHIPGAHSLPLDLLPQRVAGLRAKPRVMAYCRGKYCPSAGRGVTLMREAGVRAECLAFGVPEWRTLGLPVATAGVA